MINWNYDEDRNQIRTGFSPENITRLRRFNIGLLKSKKSNKTIAEMMKKLMLNVRAAFDYLKMTKNPRPVKLHGVAYRREFSIFSIPAGMMPTLVC